MTVQFSSPLTIPAGSDPQQTLLADMNGDGVPDLIVADDGTQSVSVLLGDGKGGFGAPTSYAAGAYLFGIVATDVNGDGLPDIAGVSRFNGDSVTTLLNNGHGGFSIGPSYAVGSTPTTIVAADVNSDGKPDLVTANSGDGSLSVLLNNGQGSFTTKTYLNLPPGTTGSSLTTYKATVADVTGDGKPDIIVADKWDNTVDVLPGDGLGGFGPAVRYNTGMNPASVAVADLNGDGRPDIITGSDGIAASVSVLLANATGGFAAPVAYGAVYDVNSIAVADLNGDGHPDLVAAGYISAAVSVLVNDGTGKFAPQVQLATASVPTTVLAADLNGDGKPDIVTTNLLNSTDTVVLNATPSQSLAVHGAHGDYQVAVGTDGTLTLTDSIAGRDGVQVLNGIQDIQFTDGTGRIDATGTAGEVARLYQAVLDRPADTAGLDYYTGLINSGKLNLGGAAAFFIGSNEFTTRYGALSHQALVQQLYHNVLGRAGDAAGVQFWTGALDSGTSVGTVLLGFSDSEENKDLTRATIGDKNQSEASRLYQAAFNRTPDTQGLDYWTSLLDQGNTPLYDAAGFAQSSEFAGLYGGLGNGAFVDALYQNVLHRAGDATGRSFWTDALNNGRSKAQVLLGFSDSPENRVATASTTHDGWVFVPNH